MEWRALIGVDTNILLRYVLEDDLHQTDLVEAWLRNRSDREPGYVPLLVLCEFAWTLAKFYRRPRAEIGRGVAAILNMSVLTVERAEIAQRALEQYLASNADFGDCCIAVLAGAAGCDHTLTFDKAASKLPGMRLLA